jgi:hypothetical protein
MDRLEESRLAWQRAQADLQSALAALEHTVASEGSPNEILKARATVASMQKVADEMLQRHITQLGKSG